MNTLMTGTVAALCINPQHATAKFTQPSITIAQFGAEGDFHCKKMRRSFKGPFALKPNIDRNITVVAQEALDAVNQSLGLELKSGDLGENITTEGLGDLSQIPDGSLICIGEDIVLRVMEQNKPCKNLLSYGPLVPKAFMRRRGLLCAVEWGVGKQIHAGDTLVVKTFPKTIRDVLGTEEQKATWIFCGKIPLAEILFGRRACRYGWRSRGYPLFLNGVPVQEGSGDDTPWDMLSLTISGEKGEDANSLLLQRESADAIADEVLFSHVPSLLATDWYTEVRDESELFVPS